MCEERSRDFGRNVMVYGCLIKINQFSFLFMVENKDEYTQKELEILLKEKLVNLKELEQIGKNSN